MLSSSSVPTCPAPALLTTASSRSMPARQAATEAGSVTSSCRISRFARSPAAARSAPALPVSRMVAITCQPASAAATAAASPMPEEVPVSSTVLAVIFHT